MITTKLNVIELLFLIMLINLCKCLFNHARGAIDLGAILRVVGHLLINFYLCDK